MAKEALKSTAGEKDVTILEVGRFAYTTSILYYILNVLYLKRILQVSLNT